MTSSGGQVEIMMLWQSGGPGSTCAVNNFFFFASILLSDKRNTETHSYFVKNY